MNGVGNVRFPQLGKIGFPLTVLGHQMQRAPAGRQVVVVIVMPYRICRFLRCLSGRIDCGVRQREIAHPRARVRDRALE